MMNERERHEIARLWQRKLDQDAKELPQSQRHRNLEPDSAEFIHSLALGIKAKKLLEIGGSSGISTVALASAARDLGAKLISIEIEPERQRESRLMLQQLGLGPFVDFVLADAAIKLPSLPAQDFVLIDCEKDDYIRFLDMLKFQQGTVVVADNILSHSLTDYVSYVRSRRWESITLPIGKGLEISRATDSTIRSGTQ